MIKIFLLLMEKYDYDHGNDCYVSAISISTCIIAFSRSRSEIVQNAAFDAVMATLVVIIIFKRTILCFITDISSERMPMI